MEPSKRHSYFEGAKSMFVGSPRSCVNAPPPSLPPKLLPFPLSREVFTTYRPSPLELMKAPLLTESDDGIYVDLIGPDIFQLSAEKHSCDESFAPSNLLHPNDAKLLLGIIPNVESMAISVSPKKGASSFMGASAPEEVGKSDCGNAAGAGAAASLLPSEVKTVDVINKSFEKPSSFVHPTKLHLRPKRLLPVLPDEALWANKYTQIALEGAEHPLDRHLMRQTRNAKSHCILQYAGSGQTLKRYSLYEGGGESTTGGPKLESEGHIGSDNSFDGVYHHIRDYLVEIRERPPVLGQNYLIVLPPPSHGATENVSASIVALNGQKLIFQKATAKLGSDARRRKDSFKLHQRDLTAREKKEIEDTLAAAFCVRKRKGSWESDGSTDTSDASCNLREAGQKNSQSVIAKRRASHSEVSHHKEVGSVNRGESGKQFAARRGSEHLSSHTGNRSNRRQSSSESSGYESSSSRIGSSDASSGEESSGSNTSGSGRMLSDNGSDDTRSASSSRSGQGQKEMVKRRQRYHEGK